MKRKLISVLTLLTLIIGIVTPTWAQGESAKLSQEEALKIVRETFDIPDSMKNMRVSYREEDYRGNRKVWQFSWDMSYYRQYRHIMTEIDADSGEIISYSEHEEWRDRQRAAKVKSKSEEECKEIAEGFLRKIVPEKFKEIKFRENPAKYYNYYSGPKTYNFNYERQVNDIPFPENNISIAINAETGKIARYYLRWDNNLKFSEKEEVIGVEEAEKTFSEKFGLQLTYIRVQGPYSPSPLANKPVQLYYTFGADYWSNPGIIDAFTGKLVDRFGNETEGPEIISLPAKEEPSYQDNKKKLNLEEVKAKVEDYLDIPKDYVLQSSRYSEDWREGGRKNWDLQFGPEDYRGRGTINVAIDAETGELMRYNQWDEPFDEREELPVNYNYDECKKIAIKFLNKVAPQKTDYVYLRESREPQYYIVNGKSITPPIYRYNFIRVVNGIPYSMNSINIEVNNNTGEIRGFWSNWDNDTKFISPEGLISKEEALDNLLESSKPRLIYMRKASEDGKPSDEILLGYTLFDQGTKMVDAETGEVISSFDLENPVILKDIQGHWAEREIRILSQWGIIAGSNDKFNPDKTITRAEFISMLAAAKGLELDKVSGQTFTDVSNNAWYYKAVEAAVEKGIVKGSAGKFYPDKPVTREQMVVMLMNALDNEIQDFPSQFLIGFKDEAEISDWARNHMNQAVELGILQGEDGYLKPTKSATKAEAAVVLLRIIESTR